MKWRSLFKISTITAISGCLGAIIGTCIYPGIGTFLGAVIASASVPLFVGMVTMVKRCYSQKGDLSPGILCSAFAGGSIGGAVCSLLPGVGTFVGFAVGTLVCFSLASLAGLIGHVSRVVFKQHRDTSESNQKLLCYDREVHNPYKHPRLQPVISKNQVRQQTDSIDSDDKEDKRKLVVDNSVSTMNDCISLYQV